MKVLTQALLAVATAGLAILSAYAAGASMDFDGDGQTDILWRNQATGEKTCCMRSAILTRTASEPSELCSPC